MGLTIGKHLFYGPSSVDEVVIRKNHHPVVFAVVAKSGDPWNPIFRLLDVGFSGADGMVAREHHRRPEWEANCDGALQIYLLDMQSKASVSAAIADAIITDLSSRYDPPNGIISIGK